MLVHPCIPRRIRPQRTGQPKEGEFFSAPMPLMSYAADYGWLLESLDLNGTAKMDLQRRASSRTSDSETLTLR